MENADISRQAGLELAHEVVFIFQKSHAVIICAVDEGKRQQASVRQLRGADSCLSDACLLQKMLILLRGDDLRFFRAKGARDRCKFFFLSLVLLVIGKDQGCLLRPFFIIFRQPPVPPFLSFLKIDRAHTRIIVQPLGNEIDPADGIHDSPQGKDQDQEQQGSDKENKRDPHQGSFPLYVKDFQHFMTSERTLRNLISRRTIIRIILTYCPLHRKTLINTAIHTAPGSFPRYSGPTQITADFKLKTLASVEGPPMCYNIQQSQKKNTAQNAAAGGRREGRGSWE